MIKKRREKRKRWHQSIESPSGTVLDAVIQPQKLDATR